MRRRELLRGLFALSAASVLNGCRDSERHDHDDEHKKLATLKVVLQGPFAVVLKRRDDRFVISAFIPPDPAHQFRFQKPTPEGVQTSAPKYHFTLDGDGLAITGHRPYIDHGLDDMNFDLGEYPEPNYFVAVDLPAPDIITYIPPTEPVVFEGGRIAFAALNHVLEYKITDRQKVLLHSKELGDQKALPFSEMFQRYQQHLDQERDYKDKDKPPHGPQSARTRGELEHASEPEVFTYFFGVGVPPFPDPSAMSDAEAVRHGLDFFNHKLVPLFPHSRNLKELSQIRNYGDPCTPTGTTTSSGVKPAVLRRSNEKPRLLLVTSAEDCRVPGLLGSGGG